MKKPSRENIRTLLISLLAILLPIALLLAYKLWPSPSPAGTEKLIPVDGLIRGEVYFYGPSDNDIRERYNGSDEERTLILLDARPPERSDTLDGNKDFNGGDLYCMADYFNLGYNLHEIKTLPEGSRTVFQYNFYYGDGTFFVVNVYPHALSVNGTLYQMEGDGEGDVTFVELLELLFWRLRAGDWP